MYRKNDNKLLLKGDRRDGFWWFDLYLNQRSYSFTTKALPTYTVSDHEYHRKDTVKNKDNSSNQEPKGTEPESEPSEAEIEEFLDLGADITLQELENLKRIDIPSLRKKIGLLYLGHASIGYLREAAKTLDCLKGVEFKDELLDCEVCRMTKVTRQPHTKVRHHYKDPLKLIHSDLMGPINPVGVMNDSKYIVTFTDDFSRYTMTLNLSLT